MLSRVWVGDEAVNQPYGYTTLSVEPWYNGRHWHCGIDVGSPGCKGKPLFAARAGKVSTYMLGILGITVAGGQTDWYVHGEYTLGWGKVVSAGQRIGVFSDIVPRGGSSTGPHLHFEVQPPGGWINVPPALDPVPVLAPKFASGGGTIKAEEETLLFYKEQEHGYLFIVGDAGKRYVFGWEGSEWTAKLGAPVVKTAAELAQIPDAPKVAPAANVTADQTAVLALLQKIDGHFSGK